MNLLGLLLFWALALVPPSGQTIRVAEVYQAVVRYFPAEAQQEALCIAYWETEERPYDNSLVGPAGEVSVWQIHPIHWGRFPREKLVASVNYATWAAAQIQREWGWQAWATSGRCER